MTSDIPESLLAYLADRRASVVEATLACLTDRERRLIREVAVVAYVQGQRHPTEQSHTDGAILAQAVGACLAAPDLYPVISGVQLCAECDHPRYAHRDGDDPVTPGTCAVCEADDLDEAHHDYHDAAPGAVPPGASGVGEADR
ncbi:hypothetical protein ACIGXG_32180 [Streptomyces goshikiensis]|uniref:hypothetical protein n=1 Tax=Streptomyces goshikiensis TaxID=1942 RepID=UPI0037CFF2AE